MGVRELCFLLIIGSGCVKLSVLNEFLFFSKNILTKLESETFPGNVKIKYKKKKETFQEM